MAPSVGRPPSIRCAGAAAWVTSSLQDRHAYLGRTVTITRSCAGTMSSRSVRSSPILCSRHCCAIGPSDNGDAAAAQADEAVGLDHPLDPGEVLGKIATVALG